MKRAFAAIAIALGASAVAIQFVGVDRGNRASSEIAIAPVEIQTTLECACYDCHSNQTKWEWYSRIAPISWYIAHQVNRGRIELNFSDWNSYYPITRHRKLLWITRAIEDRSMPPASYLLVHPEVRLNNAQREELVGWAHRAADLLEP
jgi:hypothetical protein